MTQTWKISLRWRRILIEERPDIEDLSSRNGMKVNNTKYEAMHQEPNKKIFFLLTVC